MRALSIVTLAVMTSIVTLTGSEGQGKSADLTVTARGVATDGDAMTLVCDLSFAAVPSNVFTGACRIRVGRDQLRLAGDASAGQHVPAVFLNGRLTIRGMAEASSGRFGPLAVETISGFPVDVSLDPLRRDWAIRVDVAGRAGEPIAQGRLTGGRIVFAIP